MVPGAVLWFFGWRLLGSGRISVLFLSYEQYGNLISKDCRLIWMEGSTETSISKHPSDNW